MFFGGQEVEQIGLQEQEEEASEVERAFLEEEQVVKGEVADP